MEPLNKGHFGSVAFVLYSEVVLWWEVEITIVIPIGVEVVRWWEGPLWEVPLYLIMYSLLIAIFSSIGYGACRYDAGTVVILLLKCFICISPY